MEPLIDISTGNPETKIKLTIDLITTIEILINIENCNNYID